MDADYGRSVFFIMLGCVFASLVGQTWWPIIIGGIASWILLKVAVSIEESRSDEGDN